MAPREHHVIETAIRLVDTILGRVHGVIVIRVVDKCVVVDDRRVICATDNKRVL